MSDFDSVYIALLRYGLPSLRNAARNGDIDHCRAESEHLHGIPALIGESRIPLHAHYFNVTRVDYLDWSTKSDSLVVADLLTHFYPPVWQRLGELIKEHSEARRLNDE